MHLMKYQECQFNVSATDSKCKTEIYSVINRLEFLRAMFSYGLENGIELTEQEESLVEVLILEVLAFRSNAIWFEIDGAKDQLQNIENEEYFRSLLDIRSRSHKGLNSLECVAIARMIKYADQFKLADLRIDYYRIRFDDIECSEDFLNNPTSIEE